MDRQTLVHLSKAAGQAERFDDMKSFMVQLCELASSQNFTLSVEERTLLSIGFRNVLSKLREQWSISVNLKKKYEHSYSYAYQCIVAQSGEIFTLIKDLCYQMINLIDKLLVPQAKDILSEIYCYKQKGDFYRYFCEISNGLEHKNAADSVRNAYTKATDLCRSLSPCHPLLLGVNVNYTLFLYDLGEAEEALHEAQSHFSSGLKSLESLVVERRNIPSLGDAASRPIINLQAMKPSFSDGFEAASVNGGKQSENEKLRELPQPSERAKLIEPKDDELEDSGHLLEMLKSNISSWSQELAIRALEGR